MAYYVKKGSSYQLRVSYGLNENGTYKLHTRVWKPKEGMSPKKIKSELEKQLKMFEQDIKGDRRITSYSTFEELSKYWMENEGKDKLAPKTHERYRSLLKRINESTIGQTRLADIDQQDLNKFYRSLMQEGSNKLTGGRLSNKTIREHHNVISMLLEVAWKWGIIDENVAKRADPPSGGYYEIECLNEEEIAKIFSLLDEEPIQYRTMITILVMFGLRRGELCGLEWKDIDFDNRLIHIRRTSQYVNHKIITKEPKTAKSRRVITMDSYSYDILQQYKLWQDEKKKNAQDWTEFDRLFTKFNGTPIHPDSVGDWWDKFQKKHGISHHTLHSLRHTNASILIACDTDVVTVAGRLGHANSNTTLKVYSHMFKARDAKAANVMADFIMNSKSSQ